MFAPLDSALRAAFRAEVEKRHRKAAGVRGAMKRIFAVRDQAGGS